MDMKKQAFSCISPDAMTVNEILYDFADYIDTHAVQGEQGEKGERGEQGVAGKDGANGKDGENGKDGASITNVKLIEIVR